MQQLAPNTLPSEHGQSEQAPIVTTLGELIEAINEEVEPEEDYLVSRTVSHLIDTGRIRFLDPKGEKGNESIQQTARVENTACR